MILTGWANEPHYRNPRLFVPVSSYSVYLTAFTVTTVSCTASWTASGPVFYTPLSPNRRDNSRNGRWILMASISNTATSCKSRDWRSCTLNQFPNSIVNSYLTQCFNRRSCSASRSNELLQYALRTILCHWFMHSRQCHAKNISFQSNATSKRSLVSRTNS